MSNGSKNESQNWTGAYFHRCSFLQNLSQNPKTVSTLSLWGNSSGGPGSSEQLSFMSMLNSTSQECSCKCSAAFPLWGNRLFHSLPNSPRFRSHSCTSSFLRCP